MVASAGIVEPPVLRDAQGSVPLPLDGNVAAAGVARPDFKHEVRGLALLGDDIAVALPGGGGVDVEGDEEVGREQSLLT